jgi:hypothetical protein
MSRVPRIAVLVLLVLGVSSCTVEESMVRIDERTVAENRSDDGYVYHLTRLVQAPARAESAPVVAVPPADAREIGLIEVTVGYSGSGPDGQPRDVAGRRRPPIGSIDSLNVLVVYSMRAIHGYW